MSTYWFPLALLLFFCSRGPARAQSWSDYDFDRPKLVSELPTELDEISGLSLSPGRSDELLAVQDENGKIYRLSARSGGLLWSTHFWKDGDYEGVEAVGSDVWVVKSTGTLYRISRPGEPEQSVTKFNGSLNGDNDVEGLTYDPANNRLLLACKRDAADDGNDKDGRYIYAFDLATETLSERPVYAIAREAVRNYLSVCSPTPKHAKLCAFFNERDDYDLAPSAIAVHPRTGQLYLTSSVGKILMVLGRDGRIEYLHKLDKATYPQPEGLAFDAAGNLFISSERRKDRPARLYRVSYRGK